jgi:hypothetical protein
LEDLPEPSFTAESLGKTDDLTITRDPVKQ